MKTDRSFPRDWGERGRYVHEALRGMAVRSQAALLIAHGAATVPGRIPEVSAAASGYVPQTVSGISVSQDTMAAQDLALAALTTGSISGTVAQSGALTPVAGATVALDGSGLSTATAGAGTYTLAAVPIGAHTLRMTASGYQTLSAAVTVNGAVRLDFAPATTPDYVVADGGDTCSIDFAWADATGGTPHSLGDDAYIGVTLPWSFTFYGNTWRVFLSPPPVVE